MAAFASLSWHICWTGWFMTASAGTAGACVCAASSPSKSEVGHMVAGFQRAARKGKPRCTDIIQASASVTFAHFPLAKASHVAEPGVNGGTLRATAHRIMDTRRGKIYGHCLQSAVAQIRLYFVPCTRRTVLNLLGLNLFQEFN